MEGEDCYAMRYLIANFIACLIVHLCAGATFGFRKKFNSEIFPFREMKWESSGRIYLALGVKRWKSRLPSSGSFDMSRLKCADPEYLESFIQETCRSEAVHLFILACIPLFFLLNPIKGGLIVSAYLLAENLPCVVAQRYNRRRLRRLAEAAGRRGMR
jgi:glycosyl-4,4'-diaponeurosporenoate acyltransferase